MHAKEKELHAIGFIMDGNRRWARKQGMPAFEGHRCGAKVFAKAAAWVRDRGIAHGVFYAFSTENWGRSQEEVAYLMKLFEEAIDRALHSINNDTETKRARVRFIGARERFLKEVQDKMAAVEEQTKSYTDTTLWIALSYGGRAEIVEAVNRAVAAGKPVDEALFQSHLWSAELPDLDVVVRTGGHRRLSNFMTWHLVYSELIFLDTYWPEVTTATLDAVYDEYHTRRRNFGA